MKTRKVPFIVILLALAGCQNKLNLKYFEMEIPSGWHYEDGNGTDSFLGNITTSSSTLSFEYSLQGYASSIVPTEEQYLADQKNWTQVSCYFCKPNVTYVEAQNVRHVKDSIIAHTGIKDTSLLKIEPVIQYSKSIRKPNEEWRRYYHEADYIADLRYKDSIVSVPIFVPEVIKNHNIKIDSTDQYIIKTIWPKIAGQGFTAVYYKSRSSAQNFNIKGTDLPIDEQEKALAAFKTLKFK